MVLLIAYKQPVEDYEEFIYGIIRVLESDTGYLQDFVYAGHNIRDLAMTVREIRNELAENGRIKYLAKPDRRKLPLDKEEISMLEKLLSNENKD